MKSPFPGMDPYLEQYWGDIHTRLMVYACDQINDQLPSDLQARVEESIAIDTDDDDERIAYPDVRVVEDAAESVGLQPMAVGATVAEPCVVAIPNEAPTFRHIEIVDRGSGNRVVTAIEALSPANKIGKVGRKMYPQKQREYLAACVNLVEIDLIREGKFVLAVSSSHLPARCRTPYRICVRRPTRPDVAEVYGIGLREPLPNIRIPLRPSDADVVLQLQPLIDECYRRGRYAKIDYRKPLQPPLGDEDTRWAESLLRERGTPSLQAE